MVIEKEKKEMKTKRIAVSEKRQITIPKEYYEALNIGNEIECAMVDNYMIIKPITENSLEEFSEYILQDIINEGYKNEEILNEFKKRRNELKNSARELIKDIDEVAKNSEKYAKFDDIFKEDEE